MRNVVLILALGIGAVVHFTHQLFPSLASMSASARVGVPYNPTVRPHYLGSTKSGPTLRPAVWTEESSSDSLPCPIIRRAGTADDFEDAPACDQLGERTALPEVRTSSSVERDPGPGHSCRF